MFHTHQLGFVKSTVKGENRPVLRGGGFGDAPRTVAQRVWPVAALAFDSGPPLVCDEPAATYERPSDEHGRLAVAAATNRLGLVDKIHLIPGHCDPTVNLYEWCVCVRGNRVGQVWPITAREAVY